LIHKTTWIQDVDRVLTDHTDLGIDGDFKENF